MNLKLSTILFANSAQSDNTSQSDNNSQNSNAESSNSPEQIEFEPVQVKGGKGGAEINKEIKKILAGGGTPRPNPDGSIKTIENRNNKAYEIKWEGAMEYEVRVGNESNKFRILKKPMGNDANGNPTYKYAWSPEHYEDPRGTPTIYEFKIKKK